MAWSTTALVVVLALPWGACGAHWDCSVLGVVQPSPYTVFFLKQECRWCKDTLLGSTIRHNEQSNKPAASAVVISRGLEGVWGLPRGTPRKRDESAGLWQVDIEGAGAWSSLRSRLSNARKEGRKELLKCCYVCTCTKSDCLYIMRKRDNSSGEIQWKEM